MKKAILLVFCILLVSISAYSVSYDFYNITYKCENSQCIRGNEVTFNVTIYNRGIEKIELLGLEIKDGMNNSVIASYNISYFPLMDYRGEILTIRARQRASVLVSGILPVANTDGGFLFYPCFNNAVQAPRIVINNIYNIRYCYDDRLQLLPMLECTDSSYCSYNEYCTNNKCKKFRCLDCQQYVNHACEDYQCCSSDSCHISQACIDHKCTKLNCGEDEYLFNHTCPKLNCSADEGYFNHECVKLTCQPNQHIVNNTCMNLNCSLDKAIFNNSCVSLNCSPKEYLFNHTCNSLDCRFNQTYFNHSCVDLRCYFFQKIVNHNCILDRPIIIKFSIESLVLLVILTLLVIDIRKYKFRRKQKKA